MDTSDAQELDFSDQCWVRAGESLAELVAKEPFNTGFLATEAQGTPESASGLLANRKVAMELAGHWEPGVMQGLTEDEQGLGEDTGWFPFPEVAGGEGDPAAQLGGGDAWACSNDAPDICVDFIEFMLSNDVQKGFAELDMGLPTLPSATAFVAAPELAPTTLPESSTVHGSDGPASTRSPSSGYANTYSTRSRVSS